MNERINNNTNDYRLDLNGLWLRMEFVRCFGSSNADKVLNCYSRVMMDLFSIIFIFFDLSN